MRLNLRLKKILETELFLYPDMSSLSTIWLDVVIYATMDRGVLDLQTADCAKPRHVGISNLPRSLSHVPVDQGGNARPLNLESPPMTVGWAIVLSIHLRPCTQPAGAGRLHRWAWDPLDTAKLPHDPIGHIRFRYAVAAYSPDIICDGRNLVLRTVGSPLDLITYLTLHNKYRYENRNSK